MSTEPGAGGGGHSGRPISLVSALSLAAWAALSPRTAGANPAVFFVDAGAGGALMPRGTDDVRIVSEYLEFVERTQEADLGLDESYARLPWHVRADYVLENQATERVELDVGFPVFGDRGEYDQADSEESGGDVWTGGRGTRPLATSFHVRLGGNDLRHRLAHNDCSAGQPDAATEAAPRCYPDVFLFHVAIEAHAQTSLTVEYDQTPSLCCNQEGGTDYVYAWVDYVLETGALWAGTIGRLDIVYRFAVPPPDGAMIYGGTAGPPLGGGMLYWQESEPGHAQGWDPNVARTRAPEGVVDLWSPAVRFHYAFACRDGRIVLRLKATDVEPAGNISLGVQNIHSRLESMSGNLDVDESARAPCAAYRERESSSAAWSSWVRDLPPDAPSPEQENLDAPPPEWGCSFAEERTEYRFDCCCAAAASQGGWNPDCDKPGGSHGRGCAVGASPSGATPPAPAADAGAADGGEAGAPPDAAAQDATDAEAVPEVVPVSGADETGSAIDAAAAVRPADVRAGRGDSETETASASRPVGSSPAARDASTAPTGTPPKKGCGCATAGAAESTWSGLAVAGALLLVRMRQRRRRG